MVVSQNGALSSLVTAIISSVAALIVYTWCIYPVLVVVLKRLARRSAPPAVAEDPKVTTVLAVHNEEEHIRPKLEDCLRWEYPNDRIELIVASDGSTDQTESIVKAMAESDPRIRLVTSNRAGKSGIQNLAVTNSTGAILLFTDVETTTQPDLLRRLVDQFGDPKVGLVTGTLRLKQGNGAVSKAQGLYWNYELFIREAESALGILATGSGVALAMRRELFRPMETRFGDDCVLPLDVRLQGYRVVQDFDAIVYDEMPNSIDGELRARIRMTTRNWTGTLSRSALLNPFRFPLTSWALISHKLLRWMTPLFLCVVFFLNCLLLTERPFRLVWVLQVVFYSCAFVGWVLTKRGRRIRAFAIPFSFCLANLGFLLGMVAVFRRQKVVAY